MSRRIDKTIRTNADASPTQRGIVVHGNRFISHCIFRRIGKSSDLDASDIIKDEVVEDAVMRVLSGVSKIIDKDYGRLFGSVIQEREKMH